MQERFNKQFVDEDTGLLNIGKYDNDEVIEFIEGEIKRRDNEIINMITKDFENSYLDCEGDLKDKIKELINETS